MKKYIIKVNKSSEGYLTAVKLGDFGLAIRLEENELITQKCGSPVYVAPEGNLNFQIYWNFLVFYLNHINLIKKKFYLRKSKKFILNHQKIKSKNKISSLKLDMDLKWIYGV